MATEIQDVLKINMVLVSVDLLAEETDQAEFSVSVGTEVIPGGVLQIPVLAPGLPPSIGEPGRSLGLERDRIRLVLSASRSVIEKQFPEYEDLARLAEVIGLAVKSARLAGSGPTALGYNLELVYGQTSGLGAQRYLAERLFEERRLGNEGWEMVGSATRMVFEGAGVLWSVTLDQRANDPTGRKIFLALNLHIEESKLPTEEEILDSLTEIWRQAHDFVIRLDERVK